MLQLLPADDGPVIGTGTVLAFISKRLGSFNKDWCVNELLLLLFVAIAIAGVEPINWFDWLVRRWLDLVLFNAA